MVKIFESEVLKGCAQAGVGLAAEESIEAVISALANAYPDYVDPKQKT